MSVHGIELQTQPTDTTCVHACLAMILGAPVQQVIDFHGGAALNSVDICTFLERCGVVWNQLVHGRLIYEGWYTACVPSLNQRGHNHQLLFYSSWDPEFHVLDPARGETYKPDGSDLHCWSDLIIFRPGGKLPESGSKGR